MCTVFVVKVYAQESTFVVWQDCIKTNYIATILIFALQMAIVVLGRKRGKIAVRTFCTFIFLLVANSSVSLIHANRLITALLCCLTEPAAGKHIITTFEITAE